MRKPTIVTLGAWLCLAVSSHAVLIYADEWRVEYRLDIVDKRPIGDSDGVAVKVPGGTWGVHLTTAPNNSRLYNYFDGEIIYQPDNPASSDYISAKYRFTAGWTGTPPYSYFLDIYPGMTGDEYSSNPSSRFFVTEGLAPAMLYAEKYMDETASGYAIISLKRYRNVPDAGSTLPLAAISILGLTALRSRFRR